MTSVESARVKHCENRIWPAQLLSFVAVETKMATMAPDVESEQSLTKLKEKLDFLTNGDRRLRRKAVDEISELVKTISQSKNAELAKKISEMCLAPLITCLQSDQQEYCREKSAEIVVELMTCGSNYEEMAVYFVPAATQRVNTTKGGSFLESSEEVRLILVRGLNCLTERVKGEVDIVHFDDISSALARTLLDPYPELKKESCKCVRNLASSVRGQFHQQFQSLVDPLLQNLVHQHSKVRLAAIDAIGDVVHCTSSACLKDVYPQIAQRLFDPVPQVRKAVALVVGSWMVSLPDRHSSYSRLVPLLLTCISDEVTEISELAEKLWTEAGELYLEENKKTLQDRIDYDTKVVDGRFNNEKEKRSLGCRALVTSNLSYILPAVFNDIRDWKEEVRMKAAQLLRQLLLHSEERMVSQLQKIVDSLVVGCNDEEPKVVKEVVESAVIVGRFIEAEIWWNLIEDKLNDIQSTRVAQLMVLSALIRGSRLESLKPLLKHITSYLSQSSVCQVFEVEHRTQVLSCAAAILDTAVDECRCVAYDLFFVLLSLLALNREDNDKVNDAIDSLCRIIPAENLDFLCVQYANDIFAMLTSGNNQFWTSQSAEWLIFNLFVCKLGVNLVDFLGKLLPFFGAALSPKMDYEMKFRCLQTVSYVAVTTKPISSNCSQLCDFFVTVVKDQIFPCLFWRGGRSESTIRAAALTSIWTIFNHCTISPERLSCIVDDLVEKTINLIEDDNKTTRILVCRILNICFRDYDTMFVADQYSNSSSKLLKRVDDSDEDVRLAAVECLERCLCSWLTNDRYVDELHSKHLESICKGMIIFLDDSDESLRIATLRALKNFAKHDTRQLKVVLDQVKSNHGNREIYDELIEHVASLALH